MWKGPNEAKCRSVFEPVLEQQLELRILGRELSNDGGRADLLCLDADNLPTIVEFKDALCDAPATQAIQYARALRNDKSGRFPDLNLSVIRVLLVFCPHVVQCSLKRIQELATSAKLVEASEKRLRIDFYLCEAPRVVRLSDVASATEPVTASSSDVFWAQLKEAAQRVHEGLFDDFVLRAGRFFGRRYRDKRLILVCEKQGNQYTVSIQIKIGSIKNRDNEDNLSKRKELYSYLIDRAKVIPGDCKEPTKRTWGYVGLKKWNLGCDPLDQILSEMAVHVRTLSTWEFGDTTHI